MPASTLRLTGVGFAISIWMVLLFLGVTLGGAIHLLLVGGLVAFPWRELRPVDAETLAPVERDVDDRPGEELP
ncbi:MAG: hypothetical protein IPJ17_01440 [Holophagales bacterium]|nr:MAG: hypothetical protein IPJ17_01440 [Holophagales bacterium]